MTPEERALLIKRYEDGCRAFIEAVRARPEAGLDFAPAGEWSARQVAHHLADSELVRGYRFRQLLAQDGPLLQAYDEAQFAAKLHYYRPLDTSLALLAAAVGSNVELLTLVFPEDWLRAARHEETGVVTLDDLLQGGANHVSEHVEQLKKLGG